MVAEKGYRELFDAFQRLGDGFKLVCVGPADPQKADGLSNAEIDSAVNQGVLYLGMRTDVDRLYNAMDVFVLPSHREGFPRSAMEAAATGLPVIATDIRGCREVADDVVNGRLVPVASAPDLAAAIAEIGSSSEIRSAMGAAGLAKAAADFDERRVVHRVLATYADLAERIGNERLAGALRTATSEITIRSAVAADAPFCARLHREGIATGFLSSLGRGFLTVLYRSLIADDAGVVLIAEDVSGPVGFVTGITDTSGFYRRFVKRYGMEAGIREIPSIVRPSAIRKLIETARYGGEDEVELAAELLSMAVVSARRGRGIAGRLQSELLQRLTDLGVGAVKVVVGSANAPAIAAYRKAGFDPAGTTEVHEGETSEVLVWRP
jgi:ribosomal protein S18 acetylase RimI-like enzyme